MSSDLSESLVALGAASTKYKLDKPDPLILEAFPNPMPDHAAYHGELLITCPEFTSLCPKTGQPDFATIVIKYQPWKWCVESKSLKLYLMGYRNHGSFHESCVAEIADHLVELLSPRYLEVEGQFTPRGGIPFWPKVIYKPLP